MNDYGSRLSNYEIERRAKSIGRFPTFFVLFCVVLFVFIGYLGFGYDNEAEIARLAREAARSDDDYAAMTDLPLLSTSSKTTSSSSSSSSLSIPSTSLPLNATKIVESPPTCIQRIDIHSDDAFCIDGTKPAYYFRSGQGNGISKYHVHFEGGGYRL